MADTASTTATGSGDKPLLEVRDFSVHFDTPRGRVRAVDGVSFDLREGQTLGIVGESGSGKTVLSRSIMGLLHGKNVVRRGRVTFDGRDITNLSRRQGRALRGTDVAMVFQDPMTSLNPVMKIGRQLTEGMKTHLDLSKEQRHEAALNLMRSVGIPLPEKRMEQYPFELSGGMRQRVTIAIALACEPRLLLADEPTTALDVTIQAQILKLLEAKKQERNMAMILVTHDLGVVAGRTDEIMVMYAGKVVERAPTLDLFTRMRMPYTEALLNSIPKLDEPSHTPLVAIGGRPPVLIDPPQGCRFAPRCPYARAKCVHEEPPLMSDEHVNSGHVYACWYPVGVSPRTSAVDPLVPTAPAAEVPG
ncbi:MAG: ABC transporter ATP-binding protein [Ilumatobacteraceae bacterium]